MDVISRNSMMSLFMGHMCPKSSSFCSGSSCSLSAQHLIQDNMRAHYQKVLSAKAAVDSSVPKTLLTSVKYKDQKKREKLFKALRQYQHILRTRRPLSADDITEDKSQHDFNGTTNQRNLHKARVTPLGASITSLAGPEAVSSSAKTVQGGLGQDALRSPNHTRSSSRLWKSLGKYKDETLAKKIYSTPTKATYCGDVLDKHSKWFTRRSKPFTPRTLKKAAKPFLSNYRYYMPPKRGSPSPVNRSTDVPVLALEEYRSQDASQYQKQDYRGGLRFFTASQVPSDTLREEELRYLDFLEDVTNEILLRGCYSNKVMDGVFQKHIERRYDLNKVRMRTILEHLAHDITYSSNLLDFSISYTGERREGLPLTGSASEALRSQFLKNTEDDKGQEAEISELRETNSRDVEVDNLRATFTKVLHV